MKRPGSRVPFARFIACMASLYACADGSSSNGTTGTTGPVDAGGGDVGVDASAADTTAPACLPGEIACGAACITATDCSHAVTAHPSANVWINGGTFVELALGTAGDVLGVQVADATVAFHAPDGIHLWIEIPPGVAGPADVTLKVASGSITTKRALTYASAAEGVSWTKKTMATARGGFPAIATTFDNRALVAGGYTAPQVADCTDTADLFARNAGTSTPAAGAMSTMRWTATAVTLLDGRTLVAGGCYAVPCPYDSQAIDLFDPSTDKFTPAKGRLSIPRSFLRSVRLADGRVLFASADVPSFDVYDPASDTVTQVSGGAFSSVPTLPGWMARRRDGRVLVVPGGSASNSVFDPATGTFAAASDSLPQYPDALVAVGDGRMFAIGGVTFTTQAGTQYTTSSDAIAVYDPKSGHFASWSGKLATPRYACTAVLARDGRIYVIGGVSGSVTYPGGCASATDFAQATLLSSVEIIDPLAGTVTAGPPLPEVNASLESTILFDGSLIAGGGTTCGANPVSYPSVYFLEAPVAQ